MDKAMINRFGSKGVLALILSFAASPASATSPEVRGTWLSTTGPDHIRSGNQTEDVMGDLRDIGLNTVYVETWKNGYTNFPSPTLANLTGGPDRNPTIGSSRDLVQETLIHAHRNQLNYIGWFEYGFSAQFVGSSGTPSNPLATYMRDQGWLLEDQNGNYGNSSNGFAWMNPAVPEVRQFLVDITLEAVNRYDLDGIQFDDRLAWPVQFGWDNTTEQIYGDETGRRLPQRTNDANFMQWRQEKVNEFASQLYTAVKEARPDLQVSVSPSITGFSQANYNADWPTWESQGLFDEFVPQAYRSSISSFNSIIDAQVAPFEPDDLEKLIVGIRINGTPPNTPYADVQAMIERTRQEGAAGHSLWYSSGVRDLYSSQLTAFYDVADEGHAPSPIFGADHRPVPIIGNQVPASNDWDLLVPQAAQYRLVARVGSFWSEIMSLPLEAGTNTLTVPGASAVELLLDRRPPLSPDFNGDGVVNTADYAVWLTTLGETVPVGQGADMNRNGLVDLFDYQIWKNSVGLNGTGSGQQSVGIPEPATIWMGVVISSALLFAPHNRSRHRYERAEKRDR